MATRVFQYNDQVWEDPGEGFSNEDVKKHLTQFFPELDRAEIVEKTLDDGTVEVRFVKKAGTKGVPAQQWPAKGLTVDGLRERLASVKPLELEVFNVAVRIANGDIEDVTEQIESLDALESALERHVREVQGAVKAVMGVAACPSQRVPAGF